MDWNTTFTCLSMAVFSFMFVTSIFLFFFCTVSNQLVHSIGPFHSISDGETLVSKEGIFELGFFSPGNSKSRYLGIWYKKIPVQTVVWVANRCSPINDSSGLLRINKRGNLVLLYQNKSVAWSTNSLKQAHKPIVQLLDSGNLVLRDDIDRNKEAYLWQSFEHPANTLLPGMKLGWDLRTGLNRFLSSWRNSDDPCNGDLTYGIELEPNTSSPEVYIRKGTSKLYRSGAWNGLRFSGVPELKTNLVYDFKYVSNNDEVFYTYHLKVSLIASRIVLNQTTNTRQRLACVDPDRTWRLYSSAPGDECDKYSLCGANGNCSTIDTDKPLCQCLQGFKPKSLNWSEGCVRENPLNCKNSGADEFVKLSGLKLPETTKSWVNKSMSLNECTAKCLSNCSCMAYTNLDIRGQGSGCIIWFGDLFDIRQLSSDGQDLYIRMPASKPEKGNAEGKVIAMIVIATVGVIVGMVLLYCFCVKSTSARDSESTYQDDDERNEDLELPLFDFVIIASATSNFAANNKLGQGGFGHVYRGTLVDGQEIAVKRLSRCSGQGLNEFKNEVILIAKLQHRNLVKLLGCCIQGEERLLIYEYMPNKSLDVFIFDATRRKVLDWSKRFQLICGIARGILYLHQDSRLRIIHRDLKVSNVLLDSKMTPKISDFGIARTFGGDQTEGNTNRVVGTYGYVAPEYAIDGLFSVKSDVFSFGILVLEIISGKKNRGFFHPNHRLNLTGHAWRLWKEGNALELIDECLAGSCAPSEVLRCIHVSLLCVQQCPEDRPSMSSVVLMLGSQTPLSQPKHPGFFSEKAALDLVNSSPSDDHQESSSTSNEITVTLLEAR